MIGRKSEYQVKLSDVKYDIGTKVRAKVHYRNDSRGEVDGVIQGIEIHADKNIIRYKLLIEPSDFDKKLGCTSATGYVDAEDIVKVY